MWLRLARVTELARSNKLTLASRNSEVDRFGLYTTRHTTSMETISILKAGLTFTLVYYQSIKEQQKEMDSRVRTYILKLTQQMFSRYLYFVINTIWLSAELNNNFFLAHSESEVQRGYLGNLDHRIFVNLKYFI